MSGNFTQRGGIAVMDKYTRATHAVKAGADIVFELPTVFATAPAEIFAKGAVKLANSFDGKNCLCFGTESAEKQKLISTATALLDESREFKRLYREELKTGIPSIKAKVNALTKMNIENLDFDLLKSPNNILGIEYTKAILTSKSDIDVFPIIREGAGYNDENLYKDLSSASAIRKAIFEGKARKTRTTIPDFVYKDFPRTLPNCDDLIFYSVIKTDKADMNKILDCTEGLENRIKGLVKNSTNLLELKDKLKTKRYTYTRISRILLSCMLGISESFIRKCLADDLYLKVLAINKDKTELLSTITKTTKYPLITRKKDADALEGITKECFEKDILANDIFNYVAKVKTNEFEMKLV